MVSGAYPPDICGVGDYTGRLMEAAPPGWEAFVERDWSWRAAPGIVRRLLARKPSAIVLQNPTQGYGSILLPHLLIAIGGITRRYRSVLALHEFTSLSRKAQLALALASPFATHAIFTTEVERDAARAFGPFSRRLPTSVIGILSNIPRSPDQLAFASRPIHIAYFGHIRPNKGLENFLDVVALLRASDPGLVVAVIGEIPSDYEAFGAMVTERCRAIGATVILGLDDAAVGRKLAQVRILYLPFRDGVSARRGTALAGLANGAIVASRIGAATPAALGAAVVACTGTKSDVAVLRQALAMPDDAAAALQRKGQEYIATMLPRDWAHVTALYDEAVAHALG
jgi:glycosyltransferase involved in cell wall biosynthesis